MVDEDLLNIANGDPIALVVETRCSYAAPLAFPQPVEVGMAVGALGRSSIRYRIGIFAEGADSAAAEGEFVHVVVDRTSRRPVEIPAEWRRKLEAIS
jgi:acyl-CoA thioester hydrolase